MDKALRDKGLAVRKQWLGAEYVDNSMKNADSFNAPFQDVLNEYCWGMAWTDERLPHKTRSIMNICILAATNRMHEWELHFGAAYKNGVTKDELQALNADLIEVLIAMHDRIDEKLDELEAVEGGDEEEDDDDDVEDDED